MKFTKVLDYVIAWFFILAMIYVNAENSKWVAFLFGISIGALICALIYRVYKLPAKDKDQDPEMFI